MLNYYDMSGYDLKKTFESSLQYMWSAKSSQIYRELGKMEKEGLVLSKIEQQEKKFDKKVYSITKLGITAFQEWLEHFPKNLELPIRDEFIVRVFFGEHLSFENLIFEVKRFKKQREDTLEALTTILITAKHAAAEDGLDKSYYFWKLTINKALKETQAEIEWAKETIDELMNRS
ncbi:MAG: PadR family transcriptional regulator [Alkalibacterium sp.]|nr:PadR family transcriptional regulator [Alkalibacterium sp.]